MRYYVAKILYILYNEALWLDLIVYFWAIDLFSLGGWFSNVDHVMMLLRILALKLLNSPVYMNE